MLLLDSHRAFSLVAYERNYWWVSRSLTRPSVRDHPRLFKFRVRVKEHLITQIQSCSASEVAVVIFALPISSSNPTD